MLVLALLVTALFLVVQVVFCVDGSIGEFRGATSEIRVRSPVDAPVECPWGSLRLARREAGEVQILAKPPLPSSTSVRGAASRRATPLGVAQPGFKSARSGTEGPQVRILPPRPSSLERESARSKLQHEEGPMPREIPK